MEKYSQEQFIRNVERLPYELNIIRTGYGYTMKGWDFDRQTVAEAIRDGRMLNPTMELSPNICPWNCNFCFTEDPNGPGVKARLKHEMPISLRLSLIEQAAALGARTINIVGAGEPIVDPNFWVLLEKMKECDMTPIVYTEGAIKLTDEAFVERLEAFGATVVLKMNSLWNEEYQNAIVRGDGTRTNLRSQDYFQDRKVALDNLFKYEFNKHDPTRLAFDTIICQENKDEILKLHHYARQNNIFVLFVNYLPSGRSDHGVATAITKQEQFEIFRQMAEIDKKEFGLPAHDSHFPYAGGTPCTIRGMGLHIKIQGQVFDCPGESQALGDVQGGDSLKDVWQKARNIQLNFDGGCKPRDDFWQQHPELRSLRELPVLNS